MNLNLTGKRALVTGASQGIGAAVASALADEGCDLVLVARRPSALSDVATAITRRSRRRVDISALDLTDGGSASKLAELWSTTDILVNNAGAVPKGDLLSIGAGQWRDAFDLKVHGYINMCREFYSVMKSNGGGVIINIIGSGAQIKEPSYICGAVANASLYALTQTLGSTSCRDGIRVVGVSPGPVRTPRWDAFVDAASSNASAPQSTDGLNIAEPEDIASMVAFLASSRCAHVSGTVVHVDRGLAKT